MPYRIVQQIYVFFNGHRRHSVLLEMQSNETMQKTLKRVADTTRSWRSAENGISTVLECFEFIADALEKLAAELLIAKLSLLQMDC